MNQHRGIPMKTHFFRFALYATLVYLTGFTPNSAGAASQPSGGNGPHFCAVIDWQPNNRRFARTFAANLNVGEPRTVRLIYFLPNDRPYRAVVVQKMKDEIRNVQTFYAEQMEAHGYGDRTFRFETDPHGEPIVHRVDGQLSPCHAEYLSVHSYFNLILQLIEEQPPTIDLISPRTYPTG